MAGFSKTAEASPPVRERIQRARNFHISHGDRILGCSRIAGLLGTLMQRIDATRQALHELGISERCTQCDGEEGGSCCGAGIENKYDHVLLLINLLLGVSLPEYRYENRCCYFASRHGCVLKARHVLCVNYICSKIEQAVPLHSIIEMQRIAGDELDCLFLLHETIKAFIRSDTHD